jgi:type II secretion system protein I
MSRARGFTLLEILVAIFVFATVMGGLISLVQSNLAQLWRARTQLEASELAEHRMRQIESEARAGVLPDIGTSEGTFEPPGDYLAWTLQVEPYALPVPPELEKRSDRSSVFERRDRASTEVPGMRRVMLRVYPVGEEPESVDPFVIVVLEPPL